MIIRDTIATTTSGYPVWFNNGLNVTPPRTATINSILGTHGSYSTTSRNYTRFSDFNNDNTIFATGSGSTLLVYDLTSGNGTLINTGITTSGNIIMCNFNEDGSELHVLTTGVRIYIFDTNDWSEKFTHYQPSPLFTCDVSKDLTKYAITHSSNDKTFILDISDRLNVTFSSGASQHIHYRRHSLSISNSGNYVFSAANGNISGVSRYKVLDVSTGIVSNFPSLNPLASGYIGACWNDDDSKLYIGCYSGIWVVDGSTYADLSFITLPGSVEAIKISDGKIYAVMSSNPGLIILDENTEVIIRSIYGLYHGIALTKNNMSYEITGNIVESLEVSTWRCAAYDLQSGTLINYVDVTGSTFTIPLNSPEPVMVLVSPIPAVRWEASTNYLIGTEVFPTNTVTTPFYYRCVGAGVSSATEPTWGTVAGGQTNDGTAVWEMIEGLVQPVAHMPLSPVPV